MVLVVVILGVVPWTLLHVPQGLAIRRHMAKLEAAGVPVTVEAVSREYFSLPEAENGAGEFLKAFEVMKEVSLLPEKRMLPRGVVTNVTKLLDRNRAIYSEVHRVNAEFYWAIEKATEKYKQARYDLDFSKRLEMPVPHLPKISAAYTVIELDAAIAAERGDADRLLRDIEMMLVLANSLQREPLILSAAVRTLGFRMALGITQVALQNQEVRDIGMERLRKTWSMEGTRKQMIAAVRFERAFWKEGFRRPNSEWQKVFLSEQRNRSDEGWVMALHTHSGARKIEELFFLERMRELEGLIQKGPARDEHEHLIEMKVDLEKERTRKESGFRAIRNTKFLTFMLLPSIYDDVQDVMHSEATIKVVQIGLLLTQARDAGAKFPGNAAELSERLEEALMMDPFTGTDLKYAVQENGARIYSVGKNGEDEGGVQSRGLKSDDIGFFVPMK
jgi:hypothetical protein